MKFGTHVFVWTAKWSDAALPLLEKAKGLGLDYVELSNGDDVVFDPRLTGKTARELGMELVLSPGGRWPMDCDISLEGRGDRERGVAWHCRSLDLAAEIGAVAYAGALYGHPGQIERRRPTDEDYRRIAEPLHILAEYGAQRGVTIVLEPMSHFRTWLFNTPQQLMRLIELADHPNLRVLLDTFHMITEVRDYDAAIRSAALHLWGMHACENDRGTPGRGLVPWITVAQALKAIRFDGYVAMESYHSDFAPARGLFLDPCPDGDVFVREGLRFLKPLLTGGS